MKISWNKLQDYFIEPLNRSEILQRLTMAGLELESEELVAAKFSGVVVAEVLSCEKHPDADKLSVCTVTTGVDERWQIICGASNVKTGVKVPCAKVGAVLANDFLISERKMRGLNSAGMLCSGAELGISDDVDGLLLLDSDAPVGMDIRQYLDLDDVQLEFKITPNRGDCLSYHGLAREIVALTGAKLKPVEAKTNYLTQLSQKLKLEVLESGACPCYYGLVLTHINNQLTSPEWLVRILQRSVIRAVSLVVDIGNYVMLLLGQPLHAFDLDAVHGGVRLRFAKDDEKLQLLDGKEVVLARNSLLVAGYDDDQALAIAGVMGGENSAVTVNTQAMLLEAAFFAPEVIQSQARLYNVSSDAAFRFERGVDPDLPSVALNLAAQLLIELAGAKVGQYIGYSATDIKQANSIQLNYAEINQFVGEEISAAQITQILTSLGCKINSTIDQFMVVPPSYRFDLAIKADIIEEIIRVYGYDKIKPHMPKLTYTFNTIDAYNVKLKRCQQIMQHYGFNEMISYAFIEDKYTKIFTEANINAVKLQNPIAALATMRTNLLSGLIKTLQYNVNRGYNQVRLFELARVFHGESIELQPRYLSALIYGKIAPWNWNNQARDADFFDLRLIVEELFSCYGKLEFVALTDSEIYHPGRSALILLNASEIGVIGQLHPALAQNLDLDVLPYVFEVNLDLITSAKQFNLKPLSKFQKVSRDIAFIVADDVAVGRMIDCLKQLAIKDLVEVVVFDIFKGTNMAADEKSVAFNYIFQAEKTLNDEEINANLTMIKQAVSEKFAARLR